jgi:dienelactone hydrolase
MLNGQYVLIRRDVYEASGGFSAVCSEMLEDLAFGKLLADQGYHAPIMRGESLAGVVSFHGLFDAPGNTAGNKIKARILALHGWDDPLATPDQAVALGEELTGMGADWQLHCYGNVRHAFTNPAADASTGVTIYNVDADRRSWAAAEYFLSELFDT